MRKYNAKPQRICIFFSFFPFPLSLTFFRPEAHPLRIWPQPFSSKLYRVCTRAQENCGKPVPIQSAIQPSPPPVHSLWKNDLPLSDLICRPRTDGHVSKYWPSAKLLELGDRLVPDIYYTPNSVGEKIVQYGFKKCIYLEIWRDESWPNFRVSLISDGTTSIIFTN